MGAVVEWLDEEHATVSFTLSGKWTWGEYYAAFDKLRAECERLNHPIDALYIIRDVAIGYLPPNMTSHFRAIVDNLPANIRLVLVVGVEQRIARTIFDLVLKLTRNHRAKFVFVSTIEDALSHLESLRQVI
jgi:hypothetical protein